MSAWVALTTVVVAFFGDLEGRAGTAARAGRNSRVANAIGSPEVEKLTFSATSGPPPGEGGAKPTPIAPNPAGRPAKPALVPKRDAEPGMRGGILRQTLEAEMAANRVGGAERPLRSGSRDDASQRAA